jgi:hypothetical protein
VSMEAIAVIALYFMVHCGNEFTLGLAAGFNDNTKLSILIKNLLISLFKSRRDG